MRREEARTIIQTPATTKAGMLLNAEAHLTLALDLIGRAGAKHAVVPLKRAIRLTRAALNFEESKP